MLPPAPGSVPTRSSRRIGAGGMGEVYKARDTRLDRIVAIKKGLAPFDERFEREARAIASLNHPYICSLFDVGPDYLVMEYVEGEALERAAVRSTKRWRSRGRYSMHSRPRTGRVSSIGISSRRTSSSPRRRCQAPRLRAGEGVGGAGGGLATMAGPSTARAPSSGRSTTCRRSSSRRSDC